MINLQSFKYLLTEHFEGQDMWMCRGRTEGGEEWLYRLGAVLG